MATFVETHMSREEVLAAVVGVLRHFAVHLVGSPNRLVTVPVIPSVLA